MKVDIIDSVSGHVRELSKSLREEDQNEARSLGLRPDKALFYAFKHALYRKTALVEDKIAAMWGVVGVPLGLIGQPYLVTGIEALKVSPIKFARIYKQEVEVMNKLFPKLENFVDASYIGAVRMLSLAGFQFSDPVQLGPDKAVFYKFSMDNR